MVWKILVIELKRKHANININICKKEKMLSFEGIVFRLWESVEAGR